MRRRILRIALSFLLVFGSLGVIVSAPSMGYAKTKLSDQKEQTVYITKTGKKYHRVWCRYLRHSKYAISKTEAIERGYTPCKVCRP